MVVAAGGAGSGSAVGASVASSYVRSENDGTLKYLYKTAEKGEKAVGYAGIPAKSPRLKNVNVSRLVPSHMSHLTTVTLRLSGPRESRLANRSGRSRQQGAGPKLPTLLLTHRPAEAVSGPDRVT